MKVKDIKDEAERLIRECGPDAYANAREAMRLAHRRRDVRLERYLSKVSLEVARQSGRNVGEDTATRYVSRPISE
jgi:hypothetical protein